MTKRLHEAGTITPDATGTKFRVCLIREGKGSSASFDRAFFTSENALALAGSLSFPGHPEFIWAPENRDPLSAIGHIGEAETMTIEEEDGLMGIWGEYNVAKTRPDVAEYLKEYGKKLGLSIYIDADGYEDPVTGRWFATKLDGSDPYKSVDLVVAAGAGGKFDRVAEGLRRVAQASATAEEKEVSQMEIKDVHDEVVKLRTLVEGLATTLEGKATAALQVEVNESAVEKAVESRLGDYDKAIGLINDAKLTESQSAHLRALALKGEDIAPHIEHEKTVLAEALALAGEDEDSGESRRVTEAHLGDGTTKVDTDDFTVPNFGKVI